MESHAPLSIGYTRCAPDYMQEGFVDKYAIVYSYIYVCVSVLLSRALNFWHISYECLQWIFINMFTWM